MAISNKQINTRINELIQSIIKVSDIINHQTREIQDLNEDDLALKKRDK